MAKFRNTNLSQSLMIPLNLEDQILPGTFEFGMLRVIEQLDLSPIIERYKNDSSGRPAYNPVLLLRIILFAYSRGIYSSRKMERACNENILFMAVAENERPDFTTLANFVSSMGNEIQTIFEKVVLICLEAGLVGGEAFAIDGCKLSSNAAREWSGRISDLENKKKKIKTILKQLRKTHRETDLKEERENLKQRIKKHTRALDRLTHYLENNPPREGKRGYENKSNITDRDSAVMKSSHGSLQGYNGIALVDSRHQIVVSTEAFGSNQEHDTLIPVVEQAKSFDAALKGSMRLWKEKDVIFLGDTGYFSDNNLHYLAMEKRFDYYIPDTQFRRRDERFKNRMKLRKFEGMFRKEHFIYDHKNECYICPDGKILKNLGKIIPYRQGQAKVYASRQRDCTSCKIRSQCITSTAVRKKIVQPLNDGKNYSELMRSKIDLPESRRIYSQRMAIVEPVFGNIRFNKKLNYLTLRGKRKVNIQWKLYMMVQNIEKYAKYGLN